MHTPTRNPTPAAPRLAAEERQRPPVHATAPRRLVSEALLAGNTEIEIEHGDAVYRLRVTSLGKLILTK